MKITVKGRELHLDNREVKSAKRVVTRFMEGVNRTSKSQQQPTYYFTVLLMMHILSQDAIDHMDINSLAKVMNTFQAVRDKKAEEVQEQ